MQSDIQVREELPESEKIVGLPNMKSLKEVIDEQEKIRFATNWLYTIDKESRLIKQK